MFSNNNPALLILVVAVAWMLFNGYNNKEGYSNVGLSHPSGYCKRLTDIYYMPQNSDSEKQLAERKKICENARNYIGGNTTSRKA